MKHLALGLLFAVSIQVSATPGQDAKPMSGQTGLEASGSYRSTPPAMLESQAKPPAGAAAPLASAQPAPALVMPATSGIPAIRFADERGKLENYINFNPANQKAKQLRSDPRFDRLAPAAKADFLGLWGLLMFSKSVPSHDSLIAEVRPVDAEQEELADEWSRLQQERYDIDVADNDLSYRVADSNKAVAAFNQNLADNEAAIGQFNILARAHASAVGANDAAIASHNAEVASYTAQCVSQAPADDSAYGRCVQWQANLQQRGAALNAERAQLNQKSAEMNQRSAQLNQTHSALIAQGQELKAKVDALNSERSALVARSQKFNQDLAHANDWQKTLQEKWDFELQRIEAWIADLQKFNTKLEQALAKISA